MGNRIQEVETVTAEQKTIWNSMSEDERKKAEEEFQKRRDKLLQWKVKQTEKVIQKLKDEGRWVGGLDGSCPELDTLNKEYKQRFNGLLDVLQEFKEKDLSK